MPKKAEGEFRLVLNLSYPRNQSVNDFIDRYLCTVLYSSMDDAVRMIQKLGKAALFAKADIKSAYSLLKIWPGDFDQLGFSFENQFYFDRCLPMRASISCSLFENFSTALHWLTEKGCENDSIIHYLDDFLFGGIAGTSQCLNSLNTFSDICKKWGVPLAEDKTVFPTEIHTFLGVEIDTIAMELRLPQNTLVETKDRILSLLNRKKETLKNIQSLIGMLNFACQVVVPGKAFCRRLIDSTRNVKESWHRIRVSVEMKADLQVWLTFLKDYNGVSVMLD